MTRAAGLDRFAAFLAGPGPHYSGSRNTDRGRDAALTTSALSPYVRRRLVTEREIAHGAAEVFGDGVAGTFVSEVFWRTYFKGHLEAHPQAWTGYLAGVADGQGRLDAEPALRRIYDQATQGRTGIDGFDDWARDLVETGWLHNHARMWFASIWIFTLRLPWELGAAFFLRYLLDGDPASNTLSWRWVAGLHTRGKHYLARRENIRSCTEGRYDPQGLDEDAPPLDEPRPPRTEPLAKAGAPPTGDVALLLHLDDLHPESLTLDRATVRRIGGMVAHSPGASDAVRGADRAAMTDALRRASAYFDCPADLVADGWSEGLPVVTAFAPVGPSAEVLPPGCIRVRRPWDEAAWPLSARGYTKVRKAIPQLMRD